MMMMMVMVMMRLVRKAEEKRPMGMRWRSAVPQTLPGVKNVGLKTLKI